MNFNEILNARRSIRKYTDAVPDDRLIRELIEAATLAPSPSNSQPVRFVQLKSAAVREQLRTAIDEGRAKLLSQIATKAAPKKSRNLINVYYRFSTFALNAPVLLAVGAVKESGTFSARLEAARLLENEEQRHQTLDISMGVCLQNMSLKATQLGLGSCIMSAPLIFVSNINEVIGCPDLRIGCLLTLGYPAEEPGQLQRLSPEDVFRTV